MKLEDLDLMPFGRYKGTHMQDVPAGYFHYLWTNGMSDMKIPPEITTDVIAVADYIQRNLIALKKEHKDGIWS
jgi:hypothetical protein